LKNIKARGATLRKFLAKIAFLGTCLPAGRRSSEEFAWFLRQLAEKNSEDGECKIHAGDFARFPKSY